MSLKRFGLVANGVRKWKQDSGTCAMCQEKCFLEKDKRLTSSVKNVVVDKKWTLDAFVNIPKILCKSNSKSVYIHSI